MPTESSRVCFSTWTVRVETSAWANAEEVAAKNDPNRKIMRIAVLHKLHQQLPAVVETAALAVSSRSRVRVSLLVDPEEPALSTKYIHTANKSTTI